MKDEFDSNLVQRVINSDLPYSEETDIKYDESKGWSTFHGTGNGELASHCLYPKRDDYTTFRRSRFSEQYPKHSYTDEYINELTKGFHDYKGHMSDETRSRTILKSINNCNKVKLLKR